MIRGQPCHYWRPEAHVYSLGWGPWTGGRALGARLSHARTPLGLLEGWEVLSLIRGEGAMTARLALSQEHDHEDGPTAGTLLQLADGSRRRWPALAAALRRTVHVFPLFVEQHAHLEAAAVRAFEFGSQHYDEYNFWQCGSCDEYYNQEWLACPVCRRLSRQFMGRPSVVT